MLRTSRSLSRASTGLRSNQRISSPCCLHRRRRSSPVSGKRRPPTSSAARSRSGKSLRDISWCERISRCANCRPDVPVWANSSGMAACSTSLENRNAGSSGMRAAPPAGASGGAARGRRFHRETRRARAGKPRPAIRGSPGRGSACRSRSCSGTRQRAPTAHPAGCSEPTTPPVSEHCVCAECAVWRRENGLCVKAVAWQCGRVPLEAL